jgi:hypothetical protein
MKSLLTPLLLAALLAIPAALPAAEPSEGDWTPLFNGENLDGWEHVGPGKFVVEDGLMKTEGGMGLLWFAGEKFGDCTIRVVFKTTKRADNSGVYIRIADKPDDPWFAVHHGYEVQIIDGDQPLRMTGSVYSFAPAKAKPSKPSGEWNTLEITLDGNLVHTKLNGEDVADFNPADPVPKLNPRGGMGDPEPGPRPEAGYLGLQNHDEDSTVYFKEVAVRKN